MAKFNATGLKFYVETTVGGTTSYKLISEQVSGSIDRNRETIDTTSKDHDGYSEFIGGLRSGEASFEIIVDYAPASDKVNYLGLVELNDSVGSGVHSFRLQGEGRKVDFDAMITGLTLTADMEDTARCEISLQISGKPVESVLS
ncbi:hypothetical protein GCM10027299_21920 [Larkinella ripae]